MKLPRARTLIVSAAIGAVAIAMTVSMAPPGCSSVSGKTELVISGRTLKIGHPSTFCYRDDAGRQIRFVLARGDDGKVHSVMDACAQCYNFHKGFTYSNGYLICRLCGNRYPINHMTTGKASCVPVALPSTESNGRVVIRTADLTQRAWLF